MHLFQSDIHQAGFSLKNQFKSLLPKDSFYWDALIKAISNIKPRLTLSNSPGFQRLKNITLKLLLLGLVILYFLGYYPVLGFPPILKKSALAQEQSIKTEVIADSLPTPMILPHPGYLSTRFSYYHPGVDIATGLGMPIHPISSGMVENVQYELWGLGHYITISHSSGYKSTYGHMGRVYAKLGQHLTTDSIIGEVGLTGQTSGPHTHLEITKDGKYLDPLTILPQIPDFPSAEDFKSVREAGESIGQTGNRDEKVDLNKNLKLDLN